MRKSFLIALFVMFPFVSAFGQQSLTTIFAQNNGIGDPGAGIFFDIQNLSQKVIDIQSWDINVSCDTAGISVYTREGTSQGFEDTPDGWIFVGTENNIPCAGSDQPTPLSVGDFEIEPGATTGIAMVIETVDADWNYTNGDGLNQVYNNGEIEIRTGSSAGSAFEPGDLNEPRVWNGTVYYIFRVSSVPTLSEWGLIAMAGIIGLAGFIAIRKKYSAA